MRTSSRLLSTLDSFWIAQIDGEMRWFLLRARPAVTKIDDTDVRYLVEVWVAGYPNETDPRELHNTPHTLLARFSHYDAQSLLLAVGEGLNAIAAGAELFGPYDWVSMFGKERIQLLGQQRTDARIILRLGPDADPIQVWFDTEGAVCLREALTIADRAFAEDL